MEQHRRWRAKPESKKKEQAYNQRPVVKERAKLHARRYRKQDPEKYRNRASRWHQTKKCGENAAKVLDRDDNRCVKCKATTRLAIHHIDWNEDNNELNNLVVLCVRCHSKVHLFVPERLRKKVFEEWVGSNA
jgi:hypothetical protein